MDLAGCLRRGGGSAIPLRGPGERGYHIEGSYDGPGGYWVNVRSKTRGLLALFLFSDVGQDDPPTRLVCGPHLAVAQFLAAYGEAGTHADAEFWRSSTLCLPVAHATGRAGDIYLCHPFIVHTATWPHRGAMPRMIAQPAVHVRDGFAVDGSEPSPVAWAIVTRQRRRFAKQVLAPYKRGITLARSGVPSWSEVLPARRSEVRVVRQPLRIRARTD